MQPSNWYFRREKSAMAACMLFIVIPDYIIWEMYPIYIICRATSLLHNLSISGRCNACISQKLQRILVISRLELKGEFTQEWYFGYRGSLVVWVLNVWKIPIVRSPCHNLCSCRLGSFGCSCLHSCVPAPPVMSLYGVMRPIKKKFDFPTTERNVVLLNSVHIPLELSRFIL